MHRFLYSREPVSPGISMAVSNDLGFSMRFICLNDYNINKWYCTPHLLSAVMKIDSSEFSGETTYGIMLLEL